MTRLTIRMLLGLPFSLPLIAQSNAIQLCDQQNPRHCATIKAPATLPANFTCTLSTIGFGTCSGDAVSGGYIVTGKSNINGGSPPAAINGLQVWYDSGTSEAVMQVVGGGPLVLGGITNRTQLQVISSDGQGLKMQTGGGSAGSGAALSFFDADTEYAAKINTSKSAANTADLVFSTANGSATFVERMRIGAGGDVTMGGTFTAGTVTDMMTLSTNQPSVTGRKSWSTTGSFPAVTLTTNSAVQTFSTANASGPGYLDTSAGGVIVSNNLVVNNAVAGAVTLGAGAWLPATDDTVNLGGASYRFGSGYLNNLTVSSSLTVGSCTGCAPSNMMTTDTNQTGITGRKSWSTTGSFAAITLTTNSAVQAFSTANASGPGYLDTSSGGVIVSNNLVVNNAVAGAVTLGGTAWTPATDNTVDLGSTSFGFGKAYLKNGGVIGNSATNSGNMRFYGSANDINSGAVLIVRSGGEIDFLSGSTLSIASGATFTANAGTITTLTVTSCSGCGVTSIATTSPITGGTITGTGTIACATCLTTSGSQTVSGTETFTSSIVVNNGNSGAVTFGSSTWTPGTANIVTLGSLSFTYLNGFFKSFSIGDGSAGGLTLKGSTSSVVQNAATVTFQNGSSLVFGSTATITPPAGTVLDGTYTCSGVQNIYQIVVSQGLITNYACH